MIMRDERRRLLVVAHCPAVADLTAFRSKPGPSGKLSAISEDDSLVADAARYSLAVEVFEQRDRVLS